MSEVDTTADLNAPIPLDLLSEDLRCGKYVIFRLAHGEYGIAIENVREVLETLDITTVPHSPACIAGVINLRGSVVPVIDLRRSLELPAGPLTGKFCIMVIWATLGSTDKVLGIVVDEVLEVLKLNSSDFLGSHALQKTFEFGELKPASCFIGVAQVRGKCKLLLNIRDLLAYLNLNPSKALPVTA